MTILKRLKTPTLLIDVVKCKANIDMMCKKALKHNLEFRPHFKTHQSLEIGKWFKALDVKKITVSSLTMASYFSRDWDDITVAFPTNINEIDTINDLAQKITLNLTVENIESIVFLSKHLKHKVNIFLQIDVGYNRTGISPTNYKLIDEILEVTSKSSLLIFKGFLAHAGHSYKCRTPEAIKTVHASTLEIVSKLKKNYPKALISLGDTPTCSVCDNFEGVDEIRPGNFVFYDLTQAKIGSNSISQISVAMACPIVAIHKERREIVIYGGGVHFSKDRLDDSEGEIFGRVVEETIDNTWGNIVPNMYVKSLSQEHGIITVPEALIDNYIIGNFLVILPVHSCMTVDLMRSFTTLDGIVIDT